MLLSNTCHIGHVLIEWQCLWFLLAVICSNVSFESFYDFAQLKILWFYMISPWTRINSPLSKGGVLNIICVTTIPTLQEKQNQGEQSRNKSLREVEEREWIGCGTRTCMVYWRWPFVKVHTLCTWLEKRHGPRLESEDADLQTWANVGPRQGSAGMGKVPRTKALCLVVLTVASWESSALLDGFSVCWT